MDKTEKIDNRIHIFISLSKSHKDAYKQILDKYGQIRTTLLFGDCVELLLKRLDEGNPALYDRYIRDGNKNFLLDKGF